MRLTLKPPEGAAALRVTVQLSVADPVNDVVAQENALSAAAGTAVPLVPVPSSLTVSVGEVGEVFMMVRVPLSVVAEAGLYDRLSTAVPAAGMVSGKFVWATENAVSPFTVALVTVTGVAEPLTSDSWVLAVVPTVTVPKSRGFGDTVKLPLPAVMEPPQPARA